ncbi:tyrosine-protein phosphatase 69D [Diaphorina citri]|uniref:Tyrosine-protein phosphatase 69D n=1 Tax=Diaphorina citri TaxID=121845 RepID=A0A3Q0ITZ2_DIACI|nr:tyrosine-protein phosphatase 69D [Diaphorina citri]
MFESNALSSDIYLGDNQTISEATRNSMCKVCVGLKPALSTPSPSTEAPPTQATPLNSSGAPIIPAEIPSLVLDIPRAKRDDILTSTLRSIGIPVPSVETSTQPSTNGNGMPMVFDGMLDVNSNYSGFIEVIGK